MAVDLYTLLGQTLPGMGYDLVDVELGANGLVRVFIDIPGRAVTAREGGITVDDCARVSNHLTRLFMVEGVPYERLEVSSPGVMRPVRSLADFARFAGQRAKVRTALLVSGRRNFVGVLRGVQDGLVVLDEAGQEWRFRPSDIERARLDPELIFRKKARAERS